MSRCAASADQTGRPLQTGELRARVLTVHALCEGLAALELRGALPEAGAEQSWRSALAWCARGIRDPGSGILGA